MKKWERIVTIGSVVLMVIALAGHAWSSIRAYGDARVIAAELHSEVKLLRQDVKVLAEDIDTLAETEQHLIRLEAEISVLRERIDDLEN